MESENMGRNTRKIQSWNSVDRNQTKIQKQSQIYLALRIHSEELEEICRETQMKLANLKTEFADVEEQCELAEQEKTETSEEVQNLNWEKEEVTMHMYACRFH